ncbi:L-fucose:H+ symporter permease [Thalassomonas sp. M1454]|uniref:L-fucose:H+ symporter permease n=1 Tax=Thalassomonas sp. M1454 TaxID=2594477 RepID=UPI00117FE38F|nr:L-fucose:H+ symporter permease [Thalassomonas sp. M1454]TRX53937.1 L-fucose:H+ symporter permease [Thalassomonas sp. M1454]
MNQRYTLIILTSLFFMWGFVACLNDILIPHLKNVFDLNYTQAMLVQFCFFSAYFVVSIPAGNVVKKIGYKYGIVTGLCIAGSGCLTFYPAATTQSYPLFLFALFVLASGITFLQVSANPYVTLLGAAKTASSRLTLTQAFNSLGTTIAPFIGGAFILAAVSIGVEDIAQLSLAEQAQIKAEQASSVKGPYLVVSGILFMLAVIFVLLKLPDLHKNEDAQSGESVKSSMLSVLKTPHLMLGALGIFVYVGAEVAIGSLIINFLNQPNIANISTVEAANYVPYYWGGAMVGRFIGAFLMRYIAANTMLSVNATLAVILIAFAVFADGEIAMWAILLVGLCNSIMFPTIFSLGVQDLGSATSQGSGILCLAIAGGAIVPMVQAMFSDIIGIQMAFLVPLLCYVYIIFYGVSGSKIRINNAD